MSVVEIDVDAFRSNIRTLAAAVRPAEVLIAVKADAYGHGVLPMATAALASGATWLGVLEAEVGVELRRAGVDASILAWLHGRSTDFAAAVEHRIDLGASSLLELGRIMDAAARVGTRARVHLKVDTGLNRNGCPVADWPAFVDAARDGAEHVEVVGIWSHLADASAADDRDALGRYVGALETAASRGVVPRIRHLAASAAALGLPEARFDMVRLGIAAYGVSPFDDVTASSLGLVPVMRLRTSIAAIGAGTATLPIGSAHGIHPSGASGAEVAVRGTRRRVLEVGLERTTIETVDGDRVRDPVVVFGPGTDGEPGPDEWATRCATVPDEILTRGGARLPRHRLH